MGQAPHYIHKNLGTGHIKVKLKVQHGQKESKKAHHSWAVLSFHGIYWRKPGAPTGPWEGKADLSESESQLSHLEICCEEWLNKEGWALPHTPSHPSQKPTEDTQRLSGGFKGEIGSQEVMQPPPSLERPDSFHFRHTRPRGIHPYGRQRTSSWKKWTLSWKPERSEHTT